MGIPKLERPRPGRVRIIVRNGAKDEQVEVDEAWLTKALRREVVQPCGHDARDLVVICNTCRMLSEERRFDKLLMALSRLSGVAHEVVTAYSTLEMGGRKYKSRSVQKLAEAMYAANKLFRAPVICGWCAANEDCPRHPRTGNEEEPKRKSEKMKEQNDGREEERGSG